MKLTKSQRATVYAMFGGKCAYCGINLPEKGWHADHIKAVNRVLKFSNDKKNRLVMIATGELYNPENNHIGNIFPACAPCNIDKGNIPLEDWREWLNYRIIEALRNNSSTFRHAERFGRVILTPEPLVFWFEKFRNQKGTDSE